MRFQLVFDRVKLHRLTGCTAWQGMPSASTTSPPTLNHATIPPHRLCAALPTLVYRRRLNLRPKFEGASSHFAFKR